MTVTGASSKGTQVDTENPGGFLHIPALDGIRGFAVLLVLGHHLLASNAIPGGLILNSLSALRESMWVGVNLFFALSGFLITGILWRTLDKPHFFRNFYARRSLRIFPLYYGFLFTLLALTPVLHFQWNYWQYFYLTYTSNLVMGFHMGGLGLYPFNINHFWSLQVEEQFYLVWPFVIFRVRNQHRLIRNALIACLSALAIRSLIVLFHAHLHNKYLTMGPTYSCVDNLLFGCILALLLQTRHAKRTLDLAPKVFAFCFACVLIMALSDRGLLYYNSVIQQTVGESIIAIGCTALIAMALLPASRTARLFDLSALRFFGKYSYGLYVYHYTLDMIFTAHLRAFFLRHTHSKGISVVAGGFIVLLLSVAVAMLSYHLYEKPFLKLKRFFNYRTAPTQSLSPSPQG